MVARTGKGTGLNATLPPLNSVTEKELPSVSFLVATFNNGDTIRECLESILSQAYPTQLSEIIVADGGSTDSTLEIAREAGARVVRNTNITEKGFGGGKNLALHASGKDVVVVVDADNVLDSPYYTRILVEPFRTDPSVVAVSPIVTASPKWRSFERYAGYVYDSFDYRFVQSCEERILENLSGRLDYFALDCRPNEKVYIGNGTACRRKSFLMSGGYDFDLESGLRMYEAGRMMLSLRTNLYHHNARSVQQYVRKKTRAISDLISTFQNRKGRRGFAGIVLSDSNRSVLRLGLQILAGCSLVFPTGMALKQSIRTRDPAYLWHILMAPLVTSLYAVVVIRRKEGRVLVRRLLQALRSSPQSC